MTDSISNSDDTIDSRQVIERIEELQSDRESLADDLEMARSDIEEAREAIHMAAGDEAAVARALEARDDAERVFKAARTALSEWAVELKDLLALASQAEGYADDWTHGVALIRDSYFKTYAQELADDIGAIPKDAAWPCTCIDWDRAATELQSDYTSVEFGNVTYWVR